MLCLKIASAGDRYSHSRAEALVCDYKLVHASKIRLGVNEPSDQNTYGAFSGNNPAPRRLWPEPLVLPADKPPACGAAFRRAGDGSDLKLVGRVSVSQGA